MPTFVPGLELSRRLYVEAVGPLLARHFPTLVHSAALIGRGSEVLGFDTARSTDHDWGPRLQLFLDPDDVVSRGTVVWEMLAERLPATIAGYSTTLEPDNAHGPRHARPAQGGVRHGVLVADLGAWLTGRLGFDPQDEISALDWLATPTQVFAELTSGAVFHDGLVQLDAIRQRLRWYPDDVWRYVLACQWQRISEEEPFVGRCAEVGDALGSTVTAGRLTRDLMRLCLLLDRRYPPYGKWLGSAFGSLAGAPELTAAVAGDEQELAAAYEMVAAMQNDLGLAGPVDPATRPFHDRPYRVLHAERFAHALVAAIEDPVLRALPLTGAIDQIVDNVAVLDRVDARRGVIAAVAGPRFT